MTITSNILRRDYTANGVNTTYAFDFPIFYESNATPKFSLEVIVADTTGAESIKIETTDYTITYNTTDYVNGVINQGNVVFGTAPLNNYKVSLLRKVNFTQNNDITTSGSDALPGTALEGSLDKLTLMLLEQKENLNRVFKLPKSSPLSNIEFPIGASQANQVIAVNNAGDNLTTKDLADVGLAPVSTFAKTLLDDTTASEARTTLDAQQLNANLTALAGLTGASNKIPMFSGAGAMVLTDKIIPATTTTQGIAFLSNPITISNNATDANNDIDFSAGNFQFSDGSGQATYAGGIGQLDVLFGTGNGMLATGTKAINSTYHLYMVSNLTTGVSKPLAILGVAGTAPDPTSVLPSGYTKFQRRGSVMTDGSGNIRGFTQTGNDFIWKTEIYDLQGVSQASASETLRTLTVPAGISTRVYIDFYVFCSGGSASAFTKFYDASKTHATILNGAYSVTGLIFGALSQSVVSNLSSQVKSNQVTITGSPTTNIYLTNSGYTDLSL